MDHHSVLIAFPSAALSLTGVFEAIRYEVSLSEADIRNAEIVDMSVDEAGFNDFIDDVAFDPSRAFIFVQVAESQGTFGSLKKCLMDLNVPFDEHVGGEAIDSMPQLSYFRPGYEIVRMVPVDYDGRVMESARDIWWIRDQIRSGLLDLDQTAELIDSMASTVFHDSPLSAYA